jgi:hypothetical protein
MASTFYTKEPRFFSLSTKQLLLLLLELIDIGSTTELLNITKVWSLTYLYFIRYDIESAV